MNRSKLYYSVFVIEQIQVYNVCFQGKWTNKQRVLVFCSRGISHRYEERLSFKSFTISVCHNVH